MKTLRSLALALSVVAIAAVPPPNLPDIGFEWDASPSPGVSYEFLRQRGPDTNFFAIGQTTVLSFTVTNSVYRDRYTVLAFDGTNRSEYANIVTNVWPGAPRNVRIRLVPGP